jgi:hypothetical protein
MILLTDIFAIIFSEVILSLPISPSVILSSIIIQSSHLAHFFVFPPHPIERNSKNVK